MAKECEHKNIVVIFAESDEIELKICQNSECAFISAKCQHTQTTIDEDDNETCDYCGLELD